MESISLMISPSTYYHIYNHTNGDDNFFREKKNYPFFLEKYHLHINPIAETIAWCLMPNHFHLLVRIKDIAALQQDFPKFRTLENLKDDEEKMAKRSYLLSKQFSNFFSSYSQSFNKVYHRKGSLFIKNFKRKGIFNDSYLQNIILYIHLNPVKHGFVTKVSDWEWSSYHKFYSEQTKCVLDVFGSEDFYKKQHSEKQNYFQEYLQIETEILNT